MADSSALHLSHYQQEPGQHKAGSNYRAGNQSYLIAMGAEDLCNKNTLLGVLADSGDTFEVLFSFFLSFSLSLSISIYNRLFDVRDQISVHRVRCICRQYTYLPHLREAATITCIEQQSDILVHIVR